MAYFYFLMENIIKKDYGELSFTVQRKDIYRDAYLN